MNFKIDNLEGWIQHSQHLKMMNKSIRFSHVEYNRIQSEVSRLSKHGNRSSSEKDSSKNKKQSSERHRQKENLLIAEFISANELVKEKQKRKYDQEKLYSYMAQLTKKFEFGLEKDENKNGKIQ